MSIRLSAVDIRAMVPTTGAAPVPLVWKTSILSCYTKSARFIATETGAASRICTCGVCIARYECAAVDYLASQGSLTYDANHELLYAVNAGSNTVSVFRVHGDRLA